MHESCMTGSGAHPVHRIWMYAFLFYAMYAVLCAVQETQPGRHGLVHDHAFPFTSINSLRPSILKVTNLLRSFSWSVCVCPACVHTRHSRGKGFCLTLQPLHEYAGMFSVQFHSLLHASVCTMKPAKSTEDLTL